MQIAKGFVVCVGAVFLAGCGGDADGSDSGGGPCKPGGGCQAKECASVVERFSGIDGKCGSGAAFNASCTCSEYTAVNTILVGLTDCGATRQATVDSLKGSVALLLRQCDPCVTATAEIQQQYASCGVEQPPPPLCICPVIKDGLEQIDALDAMSGCTPEGQSAIITWNETLNSVNDIYCGECAAAVQRFSDIAVKCDQGGPNENLTCGCSEFAALNATFVGLTDCGGAQGLVDIMKETVALFLAMPFCVPADPCSTAATEIAQGYLSCDSESLACICPVIDHGLAQIDALGDCSSPEGQDAITTWKEVLLVLNDTSDCSSNVSSTVLLV